MIHKIRGIFSHHSYLHTLSLLYFLLSLHLYRNDGIGMARNIEMENEEYDQFMIKTVKINWEDNPNSFMHVFVNITSVVQLEEAKNSIKCQKIMFTSASHEFRTPLNAILNSLDFVRDTHRMMWDQIMKLEDQNNMLWRI